MLRLTCLGILLLAGQSCVERTKDIQSTAVERESIPPELPDRIILKERFYNIAIIEIDSVEYLCNGNGGVIPLIRKNQKTE